MLNILNRLFNIVSLLYHNNIQKNILNKLCYYHIYYNMGRNHILNSLHIILLKYHNNNFFYKIYRLIPHHLCYTDHICLLEANSINFDNVLYNLLICMFYKLVKVLLLPNNCHLLVHEYDIFLHFQQYYLYNKHHYI